MSIEIFVVLDPAWHYENPGYQELTAVVTEVSAPNLDGPADITGKRIYKEPQ